MLRAWQIALLVAGPVLVIGCTDGLCDSGEIQARLDEAEPGEEVLLGACEVQGPLRVPVGVALRGRGVGQSTVVGAGGSAIVMERGAQLVGLSVRVERGLGVEIRATGGVRLREVTVQGPLNQDNAGTFPAEPTPEEAPTHGVVAVDATDVVLEQVSARGLARFGVLLLRSEVTWRGGDADANRGTGLMVVGGVVALEDVRIAGTLASTGRVPTYGAVFRGGASVTSAGLTLDDSAGIGAIHDDVVATHANLDASGNAQAALWVQSGPHFALTGARLVDNGLAGVVAVRVEALELREVEVASTRALTRLVGIDAIRVGDGLHFELASTRGLRVADVVLVDNERAGLLIATDEAEVDASALRAITVRGEGDALGVVAQSTTGVIASGAWDADVERAGAPSLNDAAFVRPLELVGAVAPMFFPGE